MEKLLSKLVTLISCAMLVASPALAREWLPGKELEKMVRADGKFRYKGNGWCFYHNDGKYAYKNLDTGETELGTYWIDEQDRACRKSSEMSQPSCIKGYYSEDSRFLVVTSGKATERLDVDKLISSYGACKF